MSLSLLINVSPAGAVVTGDNCSPVLLSPAINYRRYQRHWRSLKSRDTGEELIAGVVDTADKHSFVNISANVRKIRNGPNGILRTPETKLEAKNLVPDSL